MVGRLAIATMRIAAELPAAHDGGDRVRAMLGGVTADELARRAGARLRSFADDDPRVVLVERASLILDATGIDDLPRLIGDLGEGIALIAAHVMAQESRGGVMVFASRAAYLAAFVQARCCGPAWDRWWFDEFAGLRLLPQSSAILHALARAPETGLAALAALPPSVRQRVYRTLSRIDAQLLLEAIGEALPAGDEALGWDAVLALEWVGGALPETAALIEGLCLLRLEADAAPPNVAVQALRLRRLIERAPAAAGRALLARDAGALRAALPEADDEAVAALLLHDVGVREALATRAGANRAITRDSVRSYTRHGGVLLLYPHLPPIDASALPPGPGEPAGLVAWLALAGTLGSRAVPACLDDPVLRAAFAVHPRATRDDLADWLATTPPAALIAADPTPTRRRTVRFDAAIPGPAAVHRALARLGAQALTRFAGRLPGFARATTPWLRRNVLTVGAHVASDGATVTATIERPPLDVMLSITGLADRVAPLPDGRSLKLAREA